MEKQKGKKVPCPICNKAIDSRGLFTHIRLSHPKEDAEKILRHVIVSPTKGNNTILFQLYRTPEGNIDYKMSNLEPGDLEYLLKLVMVLDCKEKGIEIDLKGKNFHDFYWEKKAEQTKKKIEERKKSNI